MVRFSCPSDLVQALATAGGIDAAVETGTFRGEGTLVLREAVSKVWTVELSSELYERAVRRFGHRPGITVLHGSSDEMLPELAAVINEPVLFWLDAHGGMVDMAASEVYNPAGEATQCPVIAELHAIRQFPHVARSCVLIDDARAFLAPLPHHRAADWPSLLEIIDLLRGDADRYITILDDVIIAVPMALREVVDHWWLDQLEYREGRDGHEQKLWDAYNPTPGIAVRRLVKSLTPRTVRRLYDRHR
ncbi:MAG: class I SAM-dependent methyltransferase [Actinomycetota bacterium]|nr:class I SAM-dependent methyltransferase [Actinomycetota bacterium]